MITWQAGAEENPFKDSADTTAECYQWAADGQCATNPEYMLSSCKYSCWEWFDFRGKKYPGSPMCAALRLQRSTRPCGADCGPSDAPARARTRALSWTLVHALVRPGHYGARSSPAPHVRPCVLRRDKNFNCHSWAKAGECKSNAAFMKKQCPESCKKHDDGSGEYLG